MHLCMFLSPFDSSSDGLHIYFALVSVALLAVGWRGGLSFLMLMHDFWHSWHMPIWVYFSFSGFIPTPWILDFTGFLAMYDLDSLSRVPLCSLGSFWWFNVSENFVVASRVARELDLHFPCNLVLRFRSDPLYFPPLFLGLPFPSNTLSFQWSLGFFISCFPLSKRLQNYCRDWSALAIDVLESLFPAFFFRLMRQSSPRNLFPDFWRYFFCYHLSSFCEAEKNK